MSGPQHQRFNTATMSGVQTGSRTAVAHRLRLRGESGETWARLLWMDGPSRVDVHLPAPDRESGEADGQSEAGLQLDEPRPETIHLDLQTALTNLGWQPMICGTCRHWRSLVGEQDEDGLALGRCMWHGEAAIAEETTTPDLLVRQSSLAMGCEGWTEDGRRAMESAETEVPQSTVPSPESGTPVDTTDGRRQEEEESQSGLMGGGILVRLGRILGFGKRVRIYDGSPPREVAQLVTERSGVNAGTEPCLTCQGRIANLGALTVTTEEGDPRAFTVWRCQRCGGLFLSDWTDRWERTSSLETEETIYRLSPNEAWLLLKRFSVAPGEKRPAARAQRTGEQDWMAAFLADRTPISHQVRQGR